VAKDLGGKRLGTLGRVDVCWHGFAIECKERKRLPALIELSMKQAMRHAEGDVPMVVLHKLNDSHNNDLVIIRYADMRDILRRLTNAQQAHKP